MTPVNGSSSLSLEMSIVEEGEVGSILVLQLAS